MCGETDCPSCGPAQGYRVVRLRGRWVNLEDEDEDGDEEPLLAGSCDDDTPH
jgi:hypothetical protein